MFCNYINTRTDVLPGTHITPLLAIHSTFVGVPTDS